MGVVFFCFPLILYTIIAKKIFLVSSGWYTSQLLLRDNHGDAESPAFKGPVYFDGRSQHRLGTPSTCYCQLPGCRSLPPPTSQVPLAFFQATFNSNAGHWILCSSCSSSAKNRNNFVKRLSSSKHWSLFYFQNNKRTTTGG